MAAYSQLNGLFTVLALSWAVVLYQVCFGVEVFVSQREGLDNEKCLDIHAPSQSCASLEFVLRSMSSFEGGEELVIRIRDEVYVLMEQVAIFQPYGDRGITINAAGNVSTVFLCGTIDAGITIEAQNVKFRNLVFQHCGPRYAAVVTARNSRNITFFNCSFQHNRQAGLNAFDSSVLLDNCLFLNNTSNAKDSDANYVPGHVSAGGGAAFVFYSAFNLSVTVKNTDFLSNAALVNDSEYFVAPSANSSKLGTDGGGLAIMFAGVTKQCGVFLNQTIFSGNEATHGGGIQLISSNAAENNRVTIINSKVLENWGSQAGGGLDMSHWDTSSGLEVLIKKCSFEENRSRRGGGVNVFYMNFVDCEKNSQLQFNAVRFKRNTARAGAAVRLGSALPLSCPIAGHCLFVSCTFSSHVTSNGTNTAPLTSQRVSVTFRENNTLKDNGHFGAAEFDNCIIHVHDSLHFLNNNGTRGGALFLRSSQIKLYPDSKLVFKNNRASLVGGALAVVAHALYHVIHKYNTDCFLVYSEPQTPPSQWKTKIYFLHNSAKLKGAAVFVKTLGSCLWYEHYPFYSFDKALRWNDKFIYHGNYLHPCGGLRVRSGHEYDIATDTADFRERPGNRSMLKLSPGENATLQVQGFDELGHDVYTVVSISEGSGANNGTDLILENDMEVLSPLTANQLTFMYKVESAYDYNEMVTKATPRTVDVVDLYSNLKDVKFSFEVMPVSCRPGFTFREQKCICDTDKNAGVVRCGQDGTIYLKEGYWGGVHDGELIIYPCPSMYCRCIREAGLPGCRLNVEDPDAQCGLGRGGTLCGKCKNGLSVGLRWEQCLECPHAGWILFVVIAVVIVLCVLVIWLNPAASNELRAPLFFFQVLPFILPPNDQAGGAVLFISSMLKFGGPFIYLLDTCIAKGIDNLGVAAIGYLIPSVAMVIVVVSYFLSTNYFVRLNYRRHSSLRSFWLIILFMYSYIVQTTLLLLHCPKLGDKHVFFYDGNKRCFHGEHAAMTILATLVLAFVIIPPPIIVILLTRGYWRVDPQYVSTLTSGLRQRCLWWWAVDLGRRGLLLATFVFIPDWQTKQLMLTFVCLVILLIHTSAQPYTDARVNAGETAYLFLLCTLALLQQWENEVTQDLLCTILLLLATIHAVLMIICKVWKFLLERNLELADDETTGTQRRKYGSLGGTDEETSPDPEVQRRRDVLDIVFSQSCEE